MENRKSRFHFPLLLGFICLIGCPAGAGAQPEAQPPAITGILSGDELGLSNGRVLRLIGIEAPDPEAQKYLQKFAGQPVLFAGGAPDRYGRVAAQAYLADHNKTWLQGELLKNGLAFVWPPTGDEPRLADMLALEKEARAAKRGIWAESAYADIPATDAGHAEGKFAFVSGRVLDAARVKNKVYLNFGADWRKDFTAMIAAHDLHAFRKAKLDPLSLKGKRIRVRGWVVRYFGPMIQITDPAQIEALE